MSQILIVDDEPSICWGFRQFLTDEGHAVSVAASAEDALRLVEATPFDAVVLDVRLPGLDGLSAIARLRERLGDVPIIIITAFGNLETAVRAVQEGAFEYLPKPFDLDRAIDVVHRALESRAAVNGAASAADGSEPDADERPAVDLDETIIGSSPAMQHVFKQIALVAATDVSVLVTGESGTGKELVARAIHRNSGRHEGPFLPICLAALSPGLVESELFGHVRGAFTGATHDRQGLLELARGGTVLLDELADASLPLQVKLLRALEQREITPVGDPRPRPIDVRIIAATNRPLPDLIEAGRFREDLYFRLNVFHIHLPPLRERPQDVPLLAEHFLRHWNRGSGHHALSDEVLDELRSRRWTGNVRELRNVIEHAAILARDNPLRPEHLPSESGDAAGGVRRAPFETPESEVARLVGAWARRTAGEAGGEAPALYERFLELAEPPLLQAVLEHCEHNRAAAAALLGMHRTTLRQKLRRRGVEP